MDFSSRLLEEAVSAFAKLPGIGKKSALRMVLFLLQQDEEFTNHLGESLMKMRQTIQYCEVCHNISDNNICTICSNSSRTNDKICVVENIRDVIAIENTGQYYGKYHVLGNLITPLKGIGPEDINISSLIKRVQDYAPQEIIFVLSPTVEGDTTAYYISRILQSYNITMSTIARGVAFGGELEYTDDLTLARSIQNRLPFDQYVNED